MPSFKFLIVSSSDIICFNPYCDQKSKMSSMSPTNSLVSPMLTDMYQISMTYAHWKNKKVDQPAVFDLFFRINPFHGEFCIFAGLDEVLRLLTTFRFYADDVKYLKWSGVEDVVIAAGEWSRRLAAMLGTRARV